MIIMRFAIFKLIFLMKNAVADGIEIFRRRSPSWIRGLLPRWCKDAIIDFKWALYRSNHAHLNRETLPPHSPILIISIPKSGTHLLKSILLTLPGTRLRTYLESGIEGVSSRKALFDLGREKLVQLRAGHIASWHVPFDPKLAAWLDQCGIKRLFLYRDPRDVMVSLCNFIMNKPPHPPPNPYFNWLRNLKNDDERLENCIRGFTIGSEGDPMVLSPACLPNVNLLYRGFLGWLNDPNTFSIRFEDLIQSSPNGSNELSRKTVSRMLVDLGMLKDELSNSALSELLTTGMDSKKSPTFRLGRKGSWKTTYKREHVQTFKEVAGDLLIELGYEKDFDWTSDNAYESLPFENNF